MNTYFFDDIQLDRFRSTRVKHSFDNQKQMSETGQQNKPLYSVFCD